MRSNWPLSRFDRATTALNAIIRRVFVGRPSRIDPHTRVGPQDARLRSEHLAWMIEQIPHLAAEGRIEKASRWLGFVQGALWAAGVASIEDLKAMNRTAYEKDGQHER